MKITKITAYVIKVPKEYRLAGQTNPQQTLPTSDYLNVPPYSELYSRNVESMVVKVETDEGISGWGESQAPIGPEVAQAIVRQILAPAVLGRDPLDTGVRQFEMYQTLRSRGQTAGFQLDAIASIDTALWDIRGKVAGRPVSSLLGGRHRETLSAYVTCLTADTREGRMEEAAEWTRQGIGVKPMLGFGYAEDIKEAEALRSAIGGQGRLMIDGVWRYSFPEAIRLGHTLEGLGVDFFEAPLAPEDIRGHARLARELRLPIAVGEPLRGRFQFAPWFQAEAMDICQPDQMRNGITEVFRIATLAEMFNLPVALHVGAVTVVGMAATWQVASALTNFYIQEHEPQMLNLFNPWLTESLRLVDGELVVPSGAGLGIQIDEKRMMRDVVGSVAAALD